MVDCSQFLDRYSDFRDGHLESRLQGAYEAHLAACPSCSRYHRVVCQGVELFRDLPRAKPSGDFLPRLQHRIYHVDDELRQSARHSSGASAGFTLTIAALLALAAWIPLLRSEPPVIELPPIAAHAPEPEVEMPVLFRSGPLLLSEGVAGARWSSEAMSPNSLFFRYSPMGAPNAYSAVRAISLGADRQ